MTPDAIRDNELRTGIENVAAYLAWHDPDQVLEMLAFDWLERNDEDPTGFLESCGRAMDKAFEACQETFTVVIAE